MEGSAARPPASTGEGRSRHTAPGRAAGPGGLPSVLLLFPCGRRASVLNPEAFHEEVDDGPVEVLSERGAAEVMAFVWVYLQRGQGEVTARRPSRRPRRAPCSLHEGFAVISGWRRCPSAQGSAGCSGQPVNQ